MKSRKKGPGEPKEPRRRRRAQGGAAGSAAPIDEAAAAESLRFPIVGIGASAGGLKALQGFFDHMPADSGLAFVVVQHLDPKHESIMSSILARHTAMEVREIHEAIPVEPNKVYVKPPGRDVIIADRTLRLVDPPQAPGPYLPIDTFFRSLAENHGEQAICIVLSGAGRDGTLGLKMIKGAGGLSIVQDEEQAEYGGMPGSAIGTGQADFILPVERMPDEILLYTRHPSIRKGRAESQEARHETDFQRILMSVRTHLGTDFAHYKRSTIRRRIERRLALHQIETLGEYLRYLRHKPEEIHALFRDLTINVTSFFRDPGAWEMLKEKLAESLVAAKADGDDLRAWVVGCSTGDEAYSLAIVLQELMEEQGKQLRVKIFATDINGDAIETARAATYPDTIGADVHPQRLERYFVKRDASYRLRDMLREMVVFAVHDITRDPPFSQIDLVTCRNLLIYMDGVLQRNVIPLLHYGLRPGGLLLLGTSESVGDFGDLFTPLDGRWKIFRALKADTERYLGHMCLIQTGPEVNRVREPREPEVREEEFAHGQRRPANVREMVERMIAERYTPPAVLVDQDLRILYLHGDTERFLIPPKGEPGFHLLKMARRELQFRLRRALQEVEAGGKAVRVEGVQVEYGKLYLVVNVEVIPFRERDMDYFLVTFEECTPQEDQAKAQEKSTDAAIRSLRHELYATKQDLQATIEELETSNEELKSANEELQANNEELQSTNEELETSREELQSTNEELETVNAELQKKNEQLSRAHNDILNLYSSACIGTIFLDTRLCIKRFTPSVRKIFNLIDSDVGRPITDLTSRLNYANLPGQSRYVLETLERQEEVVSTEDGRWYMVDIRPYRTSENVIEGVVITFSDITGLKQAELLVQEQRKLNESIMETIKEPLLVLDGELSVVTANKAFYRAFRAAPQETVGRHVYELGDGQWNIPALRTLLEQVIPKDSVLEGYRVEHDFPSVGRKAMMLNARRITQEAGRPNLILLAFIEVDGRQA